MPCAGAAPEAVDVVDLGFRPHHEVVLAERRAALVALGTEQPVGDNRALWPVWSSR